jgi:hypothetical protein
MHPLRYGPAGSDYGTRTVQVEWIDPGCKPPMLTISKRQMDKLAAQVTEQFPGRIRRHWDRQHPRLVSCFTEQELVLISERVVQLAADRPDASEAEIALSADLWLYELASQRRFSRG